MLMEQCSALGSIRLLLAVDLKTLVFILSNSSSRIGVQNMLALFPAIL